MATYPDHSMDFDSAHRRIYFMGICGTAMGNAALLLHRMGYSVSGSDTGVYPPMSELLADAGIAIEPGYDPDRLAALNPDLVVIGNVQTRGNPEVEWLLETRAIPWTSLPQLIGERILRDRRNVVITGTHGKTTTTALTAFLLRANACECGFLVGGVSRDLPEATALGHPDTPFVIEGDEYDSAFFDKRAKFIHYHPTILAINNLEFDHADIFRDLADIQRSFSHLTRLVPRNGWILLNGDDPNVEPLRECPWTRHRTVGTDPGADLVVHDFAESAGGSRFALSWKGRLWAEVTWPLSGLYNARNAAMAALAAGLAKHPEDPTRLDLSPLRAVRGVRRRLELRTTRPGLRLYEDFAHHPTAIRETVRSLRQRFPGEHLTACFEPRSNTAARRFFQESLRDALGESDRVWLAPIHRSETIPQHDRLDTARMVRELQSMGREAVAFGAFADLEASLQREMERSVERPRIICVFSNGAFGGILARCAQGERDRTG